MGIRCGKGEILFVRKFYCCIVFIGFMWEACMVGISLEVILISMEIIMFSIIFLKDRYMLKLIILESIVMMV